MHNWAVTFASVGTRARPVSAAAICMLTLAGCSGVPYAPGPTFEPSPTPAASVSAEPDPQRSSTHAVALQGMLVTEGGLVTPVYSDLRIDQSTSESQPGETGSKVRTHVRLRVSGVANITSGSDRINVAAASVHIEYRVAYRATSRVCTLLPKGTGNVSGGYCWRLIGDASPFGEQGGLVALQPKETRTLKIDSIDLQVSLDKSDREVRPVTEDLLRPALVVATTTAVGVPISSNRFEHACQTPAEVPNSPTGKGSDFTVQHVVVGATATITCERLPDLGS